MSEKGSAALSYSVAIIMMATTYFFLPPIKAEADFGICFHIPDNFFSADFSFFIIALIAAGGVAGAFLLNKQYSFVRRNESILPASLAMLLAANPVNISYPGMGGLMLLINLLCLGIMMKSYHSHNATQQMFGVATWLSLGSMVQYAFIAFIPLYLIIAAMMKVVRLKECIAYLLGLLAPYWVAFGFGLISPKSLQLPEIDIMAPTAEGDLMLWIYISLGLLCLLGLFATLNNAMLIYAGNLRVRTFNNAVNVMGFASAICMMVDFDNFGVYAPTFSFASAAQISNFFTMRKIPHSNGWLWGVMSIFIFCYVMMVVSL